MSFWINVSDRLPEDGDYVLVSVQHESFKGTLNIKSKVVLLAVFMKSFRDNKGQFAADGWFNEQTGELIGGVEKWHYIPEDN